MENNQPYPKFVGIHLINQRNEQSLNSQKKASNFYGGQWNMKPVSGENSSYDYIPFARTDFNGNLYEVRKGNFIRIEPEIPPDDSIDSLLNYLSARFERPHIMIMDDGYIYVDRFVSERMSGEDLISLLQPKIMTREYLFGSNQQQNQ